MVHQLLLHIAQEEHGELGFGIAQTLSMFPSEYDPAVYPNLASIVALLGQVHDATVSYVAGLKDEDLARAVQTPWGARYRLIEMLDHLIEHEIHHRGELSLILGLLGRKGFDA
jgi:uncharacterized damage-inducible protein DinB